MSGFTTSALVHRWPLPRVGTALAIALALLLAPRRASADDKAAPAKTGSTTGSTTGSKTGSTTGGNSIADGFRSLGQQISDPKTLDRIKGHEQEAEKNVEARRAQQRKSHPGELRASDATGLTNDPKLGGQGKANSATQSTAKFAPQPKSAAKVKHEGNSAAPPAAKAPPPAAAPAR